MTLHYDKFLMSEVAIGATKQSDATQLISSADILRPSGWYQNFFKRALDIFLVVLGLPAVLIIVAGLAFCIALDGSAPFYSQKRVGRNKRVYTLWKLRSMVPNADAELEAHLAANPEARDEWDSTQKLKLDPRITRFGRLLRKSSLDELPQLWNVLKGDMSLVGPRPMMLDQQDLYPGTAYYKLRPGITGMWQVSERNDSTFADRAKYDDQYCQELSLKTDIKLLVATVAVVARATGH